MFKNKFHVCAYSSVRFALRFLNLFVEVSRVCGGGSSGGSSRQERAREGILPVMSQQPARLERNFKWHFIDYGTGIGRTLLRRTGSAAAMCAAPPVLAAFSTNPNQLPKAPYIHIVLNSLKTYYWKETSPKLHT